jgi:hypothetical protein
MLSTQKGGVMFKKCMLFFAMIVISFAALPHHAEAIMFDFAGATSSVTSITFVNEGLSVVATGWTQDVLRHVHRDIYGLGVTFSGDRATDGTSSQIDGRGQSESLLLTFDQVVVLESVNLSLMEENDGYRLFVDGVEGNKTGRIFDFTVFDVDDDYKVKALSVSRAVVSEPLAPISTGMPEPGSIILLSIGLVGAAMRRAMKG